MTIFWRGEVGSELNKWWKCWIYSSSWAWIVLKSQESVQRRKTRESLRLLLNDIVAGILIDHYKRILKKIRAREVSIFVNSISDRWIDLPSACPKNLYLQCCSGVSKVANTAVLFAHTISETAPRNRRTKQNELVQPQIFMNSF